MERPLNLTSRKQPGGRRKKEEERRRKKNNVFTIPKDTQRHQSSGKIFYGHAFTPWYSNTQSHSHWHTEADSLTQLHACKHTNSRRLSCQHGLFSSFFCRIFSLLSSWLSLWEAWGANTSFKYRSVPRIPFLSSAQKKGLKHLWISLRNVEAPVSGEMNTELCMCPLIWRGTHVNCDYAFQYVLAN